MHEYKVPCAVNIVNFALVFTLSKPFSLLFLDLPVLSSNC